MFRPRRLVGFLSWSVVLFLLSACTLSGGPSTGPSDTDLARVLVLVNQARAQGAVCGGEAQPAVAALGWDAILGRTAQKHSEDMATAGVMSHDTPEGARHFAPGTRFNERILQEGYGFTSAGENIAFGFSSADSVMAAWLNSPGHCRNIMRAGFQEIGLGKEGSYWTQVFAAPAE